MMMNIVVKAVMRAGISVMGALLITSVGLASKYRPRVAKMVGSSPLSSFLHLRTMEVVLAPRVVIVAAVAHLNG